MKLGIGPACTACGACVITCPEFALTPAPIRPAVVAKRCTGCMACVEVCPVDAVEVAPPVPARGELPARAARGARP